MNKEEYRKHCEKQIDRCIKLNDSKHLKEHELALTLLNECEERKQDKDNLIKYLEDKINMNDIYLKEETDESAQEYLLIKRDILKDVLERVKSALNE